MLRRIYLFVLIVSTGVSTVHATDEPYVNMLKGTQLTAGSFFTVTDEKIRNAGTNNFNLLSVDNIISFEIDFYSQHYFYNTSFSCKANITIEAYDRYDTTQVLSGWPKTIDLEVKYDKTEGQRYKGIALYKFKGAHKFKVILNSISSTELGNPLPAIFLLKGTTIVHDRKYSLQNPAVGAQTIFRKELGGTMSLRWNPNDYAGAEEYDLEYTFIDKHSWIAERLRTAFNSGSGDAGPFQVPADTLNKWFKNNNTRVTVANPFYLLNLSYDSGYILFRTRGVQMSLPPDELRLTTSWNYGAAEDGSSSLISGVVFTEGHEQKLNWQYSASFAEEGKRKEVMSYFDGSLRSRQAVTINNSDNRSVVQESVYDNIGRPVVNILPSPADDSTLHYFKAFNKNQSGYPLSFSDINYANCEATVGALGTSTGASQYYSPLNPFTGFIHRNYIPDAFGYPFTVTEYTPDNTGRIKRQSGVGPDFKLNGGHETSYFYGQANQPELDRLFGTEVGDGSHYLKNMVVDPNGQVSVSYVDANGKTIATALAGNTPPNLQSLPSNSESAVVQVKSEIIQPKSFSRNAADYSMYASATFLAPVGGNYKFNYKVDPMRLDVKHGTNSELTICNTCYYDLLITVRDGCNTIIDSKSRPAGLVFDTSCAPLSPINDSFTVSIEKIGEYFVSYELRVSKAALDFYDSVHIEKNTNLKKVNNFLLEQLKQTDFTGCYSNCETCKADLGEKEDFNAFFKGLYRKSDISFGAADSLWVDDLYDSLYVQCQNLQSQTDCGTAPCDERLELLKADVSPTGQYALVDSTWSYFTNVDGENDSTIVYSFHDDGTNVLYNYQGIDFTNEEGNPDLVKNSAGNLVPVKQLTQDEFVKNWKTVWADSLVKLHPEYCYYLWCLANPGSYAFDDMLEELDDADSAIRAGYFDAKRLAFDTLVNYDPFFNGGKGSALKSRMRDSLRLFSRTLLRYSVPDKTILQFIDVSLYCSNQYNGWESCLPPDSSCRSDYQEWLLYKNLYLNLKRKFYEEARRSDPQFATCSNCYIGKDALHQGDGGGQNCITPPISDFSITDFSGFKKYLKYKNGTIGVPNGLQIKIEYHRNCTLPECGQPFTLDTLTRIFQTGQKIDSFLYSSESSDFRIISIACNGSSWVPFTDSTCDYVNPDGVYIPFDRKGLSFYIESGNPNTPPTGTPSGYQACQFYNVFHLQKTAFLGMRFFNVWVCVYDSSGTAAGTGMPSQCDNNPLAATYKDKIRRYPDYVDMDDFVNKVLAQNPANQSSQNEAAITDECKSTCEAQADNWIESLSKCTTDQTKLAQLRAALVEVCQQGCVYARTGNGASSVPAGHAGYTSFEEAIASILGAGALSDSCTAELIGTPYPYDKQPFENNRMIYSSNIDICTKLHQYQLQYNASGFDGNLHQYLQQLLKVDYQMDTTDLDNLIRSCTQCNGILREPILLPIAFEPTGRPCLDCNRVQQVLTAFTAKYYITASNPRYETLLTNYFNHSLGFSLTFVDYKDFMDSCAAHSGVYDGRLCDQPVSPEVDNSSMDENGCTIDLFNTALENAYMVYNQYIDSVHKAFREAWMTKCMNVQANLSMTAALYEYHYTLYYYDQSGNLVKTIPPEGVKLLTDAEIANVELYRKLKTEGCYQYSDSIVFNNNGQINFPLTNSPQFENGAYTIETHINLATANDQVILSRLQETQPTTGSYLYQGFMASVKNNKLFLEFYGLDESGQQALFAATSVATIPGILPLHNWQHLVIERTGDVINPVKVFINANEITLTVSETGTTAGADYSNTASLIVASHEASSLPVTSKLTGSLKNLRIYNRLLSTSEIVQNAFDVCQLAASGNGLVFWAPMNDATGGQVEDAALNNTGSLTGFTWQAFAGVFPDHALPTTYVYNSLNQVIKQNSPDGGESLFWYDRLGRLIVSQNAEQKNSSNTYPSNRYSYTRYDALGRITEVGEKSNGTDITLIDTRDDVQLGNWLNNSSTVNAQITKTLYDNPVNLALQTTSNSRKRVVASIYLENQNDAEGDSTLYSYDLTGNVKTLIQHVKALVAADADNGKKRLDYDYDLVSGKVNRVNYQRGKGDQFFYKYSYDAENRITGALTSRDELVWTEDASYRYYLHGPLARTELGQYKVQGSDYAYTLQGWMKGINSDALNSTTEMGQDGETSTIFSKVSKDVYGFKLGYFTNDYQTISTSATAFSQRVYSAPGNTGITGRELFNGNISYTTLALSKIGSGVTSGYTYGYDQLNRLVEMRQHTVTGAWSNSNIISAYSESIAYDANGNILKYLRNGANTTGNPLDMDSLSYQYNRANDGRLVNNRLNYVKDAVASSNYTVDIDDQSEENYNYDKIGNLTKDNAEHLSNVNWTVYGKIRNITKTGSAASQISYGYDPGGNRTLKTVQTSGATTHTFYVRDAQGNVMAIYNRKGSDAVIWSEQDLYGSSRLGLWRWDTILPNKAPVVQSDGNPIFDSLLIGSRTYELTNHLGNVLSTISDKKIGHDNSGVVDYYVTEVLSQNDYYPFGMMMPERKYSLSNSYRYGFNGKEDDVEIEGQQDYGMRIYDKRLGRFKSVDPLTSHYSYYSPYAFAGNKPIQYIDLDGAEETLYGLAKEGAFGKTGSKIVIGTIDGIDASLSKTWSFLSSDMWKASTWKKAASALGTVADITVGNMDGRNDQLAYNVIQPKVDNFKKEVVHGDAYSRSKYFSEVGTDILTAYIGSKGLSALKGSVMGMVRGNLAASFYAKSGFTAESALSHMEGIDFAKAVQTATLKKGTVIQQWVGENGVGNYFTTLENGSAKNLGLTSYEGRTLQKFTLTEDVKVLKSTAADYKGSAGGGTQFFSTELKSKVVPTTQTP